MKPLRDQLTLDDLLNVAPVNVPSAPAQESSARLLALAEIERMLPNTPVWIETHRWGVEQPAMEFFYLFPAKYFVTGIPLESKERMYTFTFIYTDRNTYLFKRDALHFGREWRVWTERPTDEQREATPWERRSD